MEERHVVGKRPVSSSSPARGVPGHGRDGYFLHRDQGPSSYNVSSNYEQGEGARYLNHDLDGTSRFENLEHCRAELLRKLDELQDHLSRSCEVTEKPRQRMGTDIMISTAVNDPYPRNRAAYVQEGVTRANGVNQHPVSLDDTVHPHLGLAPRYVPYNIRDSHFHRGYPNEGSSYANIYQQEMARGPYGHPQSKYLHQPYHENHHGYSGSVNNPDEDFFHYPTCSCVQCFDKDLDLPAKADPSYLYNQRSPHVLSNPSYHQYMHPIGHVPQVYRSEGFNSHSSRSRSQPSMTPNSTDLDFENDRIHQSCLRKMEEAQKNRLMMHPVAGGAPFIACTSCFESLRLPRKHISLLKRQQKLKCGACSSIILFELGNKALAIPVSGSLDHVVTETDDCSSLAVDEDADYDQGGANLAEDTYACSGSNDDSPKVSLADNRSTSDEYEKPLDSLSSVSSLSKDQQLSDALPSEKQVPSSAELHVAEVESLPHPILCTKESPDHRSANIVVSPSHNGNKGTKSEFDRNVSWQNSERDSAVSTEIESKEFPKSCISQDTWDESKEHHLRGDKGAESSSSGLTNSRSGDFVKWAQNAEVGTSHVFVNGHLIPENLVQKAELLAGPIQPGEYWYDVRAGFWGVMGYPCLGIVMPNIEEFNYPMLEKCAAGNTGVVVNGRELHQKDLDLLAGRGLPIISGRSYLVKISGEVVDKDTGEELDSIGKLAPTVERAKHGFGMKVPRFIARFQS